MLNLTKLTIVCVAVVVATAGQVNASVVIDFESLKVEDDQIHDVTQPYLEDGFKIVDDGESGLVNFGTLNVNFSGSTSMAADSEDSTITLTKVNGDNFAITKIDLAEAYEPYDQSATTVFTGVLTGGTTVSQAFTTDGGNHTPETFVFNSNFLNIESVSWVQVYAYHQFDNLVMAIAGGDDPEPIPEPSSIAMWSALGLIGLALTRRKRKLTRAAA